MNWSQRTPVTIAEAQRAADRGEAWRVRAVFVGANPANASGRSDKWWEAASDDAHPLLATIRWGATGTNGQSMQTSAGPALAKAREKERKGYRLDVGARAQAPAPTSLQALVNAATWRPCTQERAFLIAGEHGFVSLDLGIEAFLRTGDPALPVLPYLATDGALWALAPDATRGNAYYARLRAA